MDISLSHSTVGIDGDELAALYRAAGLGNKSAESIKTAFLNSQYHCFVWDREKLIGAGLVLADGADCAYLCDVAVLPDHQGRGIGREIVGRLVAWARGHRKILLYAMPGKEDFYRSFGFQRMCTAMGIFADRGQAEAHGFLAADGPCCAPARSGGKSVATYWNAFNPEYGSRWAKQSGLSL
ncbi:MAG: GNAT family N-acetyltransferase [Desulfurivibrionaceae bacterium]